MVALGTHPATATVCMDVMPLGVSGHQEFDITSGNAVTEWIDTFCFIKHKRTCISLYKHNIYIAKNAI